MKLQDIIKTKEGKQIATMVGIAVLLLTGVHYYYRIKISRLQIEDLEEENEKEKENK